MKLHISSLSTAGPLAAFQAFKYSLFSYKNIIFDCFGWIVELYPLQLSTYQPVHSARHIAMNTLSRPRQSLLLIIGVLLLLCAPLAAQTSLNPVWENHTAASPYAHSRILPNASQDSIYAIYHMPQGPRTLVACKKINQAGEAAWTYTFEPETQFTDNRLVDATLDPDGNLLIAINAQFFVFAGENSHYGSTVFVLKLNPDGQLIWQKNYRYDNDSYTSASCLLTDEAGTIFLSGARGEARFQWTEDDAFVIALNKAGSLKWDILTGYSRGLVLGMLEGRLQLLRRENYFNYYLHSIDPDTGTLLDDYHISDSSGNSSYCLSQSQANYLVLGNDAYRISEMSLTGELLWSYELAQNPRDVIYQILDGPSGELYVLGRYNGNLLLSKLDSEGRLVWERSYEGDYFCSECASYKYQPMQTYAGSLFVLGTATDALRLLEFDSSSGDLQQEIHYEVADASGLSIPRSLINIGTNFYWSSDVQSSGEYYFTLLKYAVETPTQSHIINSPQDLQVYPNPTSGSLTIEHPDQVVTQSLLFDAQGRQIKSTYPVLGQPSSTTHDLSFLPAGIYWMKIFTENEQYSWQKIVKQ